METVKPHLVSPNNYINGWKIINEHITTLAMPTTPKTITWSYEITKNNIDKIMKCIGYNGETSHRMDYLQYATNDFKNAVIANDETTKKVFASLLYTNMDVAFNCSKYRDTNQIAVIHHVYGEFQHDAQHVDDCIETNFGDFPYIGNIPYTVAVLTKIANMLIIRGIPSFIMQLPTLIPDVNPFLTVTTYRLKIPNRNVTDNPNKIFDYDEIPKNDVAKIEKINQRLHELYTEETRKYKISQNLSYKEFCQKYLTNGMHKIYITIIGGTITNVLFCINSNILRLDFYTLNGITINEWINYVANDDEIIVNDVMRNRELLLPENNVKVIGKQYLYFFNRLVKNMSGTGYAITVY